MNLYFATINGYLNDKGFHQLYWTRAFNRYSANRKLRKILRKELRPNGYEPPYRYDVIKYKNKDVISVVFKNIRLW